MRGRAVRLAAAQGVCEGAEELYLNNPLLKNEIISL